MGQAAAVASRHTLIAPERSVRWVADGVAQLPNEQRGRRIFVIGAFAGLIVLTGRSTRSGGCANSRVFFELIGRKSAHIVLLLRRSQKIVTVDNRADVFGPKHQAEGLAFSSVAISKGPIR